VEKSKIQEAASLLTVMVVIKNYNLLT